MTLSLNIAAPGTRPSRASAALLALFLLAAADLATSPHGGGLLLPGHAAAQTAPADMLERARPIIAELMGIDAAQIVPQARLAEDLGADELDLVELVMAMEEEFGVEISDDRMDAIVTVDDLVAAATSSR